MHGHVQTWQVELVGKGELAILLTNISVHNPLHKGWYPTLKHGHVPQSRLQKEPKLQKQSQ
jgi:hypothetical protein